MINNDYNFCKIYIELILNLINEADQKTIDYNEELRYKALVALEMGDSKYQQMTAKQINEMFDDILFIVLEEVKNEYPRAYEILLNALDECLKGNQNIAQN